MTGPDFKHDDGHQGRRKAQNPVPIVTPPYDIAALGRAVRRNIWYLAIWMVVCWSVAGLVILRTPVEYTATTEVVLESNAKKIAAIPNEAPATAFDSAQAESRMAIIRSERLLRFVFDTLDLKDSPAYKPGPPGIVHRLLALFVVVSPPGDADTASLLAFMDKVGARRVGLSYVIEISFRSNTAATATSLANSVTAAFIRDRVKSGAREEELLSRRLSDVAGELALLKTAVLQGIIPDASFPDADARVIGAAMLPLSKSAPQTTLIILFATVFSLLTGLAWIVFRHNSDRTLRSPPQVRRKLGVPCIASVASVGRDAPLAAFVARRNDALTSAHRNSLRSLIGLFTKATTSAHQPAIGFVSCRKGEGTSSICHAVASVLSKGSRQVVLVDANVGNAALTATVAPSHEHGLCEALASKDPGDCDPFVSPSGDGYLFLPAGQTERTHAMYADGWKIRSVVDRLRARAVVIVDLPPWSISQEARNFSAALDGIVLVVEAGTTTIDTVFEVLTDLSEQGTPIFGIVLNRHEERSPIFWRPNARRESQRPRRSTAFAGDSAVIATE